jgi:hypothetical protein
MVLTTGLLDHLSKQGQAAFAFYTRGIHISVHKQRSKSYHRVLCFCVQMKSFRHLRH